MSESARSYILDLPPKQQVAAVALAAGETQLEAAALAEVDPKTIYRWRQAPIFIAAVEHEAEERFHRLELKAEEKLEALLGHKDPKIILGAVAIVLRNKTRRVLHKHQHEYGGGITIQHVAQAIGELPESDFADLAAAIRQTASGGGGAGNGRGA